MSNETIGKCFMCKKEITRHDISHVEDGEDHPVAAYHATWPGDGVLCTEHPGVREAYMQLIADAGTN